jgi:hypothetical protein
LTIGGKSNLRSSATAASAVSSSRGNTRNDMNPSSNVSLSSTEEKYTQSSKSNDPAIKLCINIGKALKKIDRGLFQEWVSWCNGLISFNSAIAMWDFFEPMACDVLIILFFTHILYQFYFMIWICICLFIYFLKYIV